MWSFAINATFATIVLILWETTGFQPFLFTAGFCTGLAISSLIIVVIEETK